MSQYLELMKDVAVPLDRVIAVTGMDIDYFGNGPGTSTFTSFEPGAKADDIKTRVYVAGDGVTMIYCITIEPTEVLQIMRNIRDFGDQ